MELLAMDWSGFVLTFFFIYGIYAPCLLTLLDKQHNYATACWHYYLVCCCHGWVTG